VNDKARLGLVLGLLLVVGAMAASFLLEAGSEPDTREVSEAISGARSDIPFDAQQGRIRVEVLNGAGDVGAAARVTEVLRAAGFDVKTYGNAGRYDYELSIVLDRSGRPGAADAVAAALRGAEVREELDSELYLDATVILVDDWRSLIEGEPPTNQPR
jgi:hypothetical protein